MDWLLATPQLHSTFSSLGTMEGETYVVSPNALVILEEINYKLIYEDQTLRTFRRSIGFSQNVRSDLIPLLKSATSYDVLDSVIRILVNLTVPVECLFSVDVMYRTEVGRHTIFELNKLLYTSKEAFTDPKSTKPVVEFMKHILESDSKLSVEKCNQINNCLLLLRNILHIPETNVNFILPSVNAQSGNAIQASMQNAILWNLFIQSIDKLLIYLMTCPQRSFWGVTMVQLIALLYKDQHTTTMTKLLNMWFEASLSESSEDNESNTTPSKQGSGGSSPMLTSDPTSDSSDNGIGGKNESSEDRRQALREETKATLQEVSRKGHEYQNSILRVPAQKRASLGQVDLLEDTILESIMEQGEAPTNEKHEQEQPANCFKNTSNTQVEETFSKPMATEVSDEAASFMPPPALPTAKSHNSSAEQFNATANNHNKNNNNHNTPTKPSQKVRHCPQLQLTKGKCQPQKRECPSSNSELSDCGYATQAENQESISTSSNDDDSPRGKPQHQKPPCNSKPRNKPRAIITLVTKKELRRKKLVKRSKSSLINMKGLVQHTPTDEDISNLLKEFTVDFLLKGYGCLVEDLHNQLVTNVKIVIDTSHYFWLVTYFLKFAAQLELDLEHMNSILTFDVISYLVYEGVTLCEQLDLNASQEGSDLKPYLRRLHLVVTAIREFLQAIETFKKVTHLSEEDRDRLQRLQVKISSSENLRNLFVLLLRRFNPSLHSKQYLQDLIVTNHILLLLLDNVTKSDNSIHIKMIDHISQFATLEVMFHYGTLLEEFDNNGEFVNDCIFTMMHHIGGDLGQINTLFQPVILKTYSRIWEADYELCDDWSDLIEYVIHKFMKTPQNSSLSLPPISLTALTKEHNLENTVFTWTQEEMDTLYWYYVQSKKTDDVVGKIVKLFSNNGNKQKSRISIIQQLLQQDIITLVEYDDLMKFEDAEYQRAFLRTPSETTSESGIELRDSSATLDKPSDDIQILLDLIIKEKSDKHLTWLQKLLLECCYVKLTLKANTLRQDNDNLEHIMEPMAYHCILKNKSIPIVQWNSDQASTMLYQPFVLLLHKLGFQLPADAGSIFARIPDFWTADTMYGLAKKLGPLDKLLIKFDVSLLKDVTDPSTGWRYSDVPRASLSSVSSLEIDIPAETEVDPPMERTIAGYRSGLLSPVSEVDGCLENEMMITSAPNEIFAIPKAKHCNSIIRFTPDPPPPPSVPNWLQLVMRSKFNTTTTTATTTATSTSTCVTNRNDLKLTLANMSTLVTIPSGATSYIMTTTTTAASAPAAAATSAKCLALHSTVDSKTSSNTTSAVATMPTTPVHKHNTGSGKTNNNNSNNNNNNNNCNYNGHNNSNKSNNNNTNNAANMSNVTVTERTNSQTFNPSDDDSAMRSLDGNEEIDRNDSSGSSGFYSHRKSSGNLECEYSAMIASVYENEFAKSDQLSVTCDLTQMYVSDEDEKPEITSFN